MISPNFPWNFPIHDRATRGYVRDTFIPQLQAEIEHLRQLDAKCRTLDIPPAFGDTIRRKTHEVNAAEARLRLADRHR